MRQDSEVDPVRPICKDWEFYSLKTFDGLILRYGVLKCEKSSQVVYLVHGRSEWIEKYTDVAQLISRRLNATVVTWDLRGQGASEGLRGHVVSINDYVQDFAAVVRSIDSHQPFSVIAHSTGALLTLHALSQQVLLPSHAILLSPPLRLPGRPLPLWLFRVVVAAQCAYGRAEVTPWLARSEAPQRFEGNRLTSCPRAFQRVIESPYPLVPPTYGWLSAIERAGRHSFSPSFLQRIKPSLLLLWGQRESVVDIKASGDWWNRASELLSCQLAMECVPNARHELLNERSEIVTSVVDRVEAFLQRE
jgi:lysophospholipase